jgi:hypothetical protein
MRTPHQQAGQLIQQTAILRGFEIAALQCIAERFLGCGMLSLSTQNAASSFDAGQAFRWLVGQFFAKLILLQCRFQIVSGFRRFALLPSFRPGLIGFQFLRLHG